MEFDELSKRVTENWAQGYWSRRMSSALDPSGDVVNRTGYYTPQVLFVSFVVKPLCASSRKGKVIWGRTRTGSISLRLAGVKIGLLINCNVTSGGVVNRTGYYTPQVFFVVKQ